MTTRQSPTCTRRIEFDAAHRVMQHESKCKNLHGHRYVIEATFAAKGLDTLGRVIDFGIVKEVLGRWIDDNWDHATILFDKDQALGAAISAQTGQKIFYLGANPTAENMADYLIHNICPALFDSHGVSCVRLRLYETPNCYAEATA
jgi:6-pyruvoyltetrahydropterin/6-carboxytetrahydropterin synthase